MKEGIVPPAGKNAEPFDLAAVSLGGTHLIEAGAGTGKTYAITGLYLRLLVEAELQVGEILAVTYTVAATEELKTRIRRRIREAIAAFRGRGGPDPFLEALVGKFPAGTARQQAEERLSAAIREFDRAAIHTIHGFCQRILQEHAFASGMPFDTELITDDREIRREIVEDFWRTRFATAIPELAAYAVGRKVGPAALLELVTGHAAHPDVRLLPELPPPDEAALRRLIGGVNEEFAALKSLWRDARTEVCARLCGPALKANIYRPDRVQGWADQMEAFLSADRPPLPLFDAFDRFAADRINQALKKGQSAPAHPVFASCQRLGERVAELQTAFEYHLLFWKTELFRIMRKELPGRKRQRNVLHYDDLLLCLREALRSPQGAALAEIVRHTYRAALIDEFQDTDPVQYEIFSTVFQVKGGILFLIGDPKQAIYSFRGADVFAYLKAAVSVDDVRTLDENWRSEPALIRAVNALFSPRENPFVFPEIAFRQAKAGPVADRDILLIDGHPEAPLHWWFLARAGADDGEKPVPKGIARPLIARSVAAEIARLIHLGQAGRALLGGRPLQPGDIAVLVRTNREALLCQDRLRLQRVPAVLYSTGSLFDAPEAFEVESVLRGVLDPDREEALRAALATDLIGCRLADLDALNEDDRRWESWRERFLAYRELWLQGGFLAMFRALLDREHVRSRLLAFPDGERRLTNVLHLAEVINRQAHEGKPGRAALLKWLSAQRDSATPRSDEHQLRLESDARAVRLVTIHKSKGLEYPVVFCPFAWGDAGGGGGALFYHDPETREQVYDLGSDEAASGRQPAAREGVAEEVRLLYVALTRARNRCIFVWGRINETALSAPAYLFHGRPGELPGMPVPLRERSGAEMFGELEAIAESADGTIALSTLDPAAPVPAPAGRPEAATPLSCRTFTGVIDRSWRMASFSLLASGSLRDAERPDHDEGDRVPAEGMPGEAPEEGGEEALCSLPGGRRIGTLLHTVLETADFGRAADPALDATIAVHLRENGFEPTWSTQIRELIRRVGAYPLATAASGPALAGAGPADPVGSGPIYLSGIAATERLSELEFTYPLKPLSPQRLTGLFQAARIPGEECRRPGGNGREGGGAPAPGLLALSLGRLRFDPVRGFMKGFIDLVFRHDGRYYLVDWKSNFLGPRQADYRRDRLLGPMVEHAYILQYHLYVVALHRYLQLRQPGYDYRRHFGGVYYLFVRGMNPAWGEEYGVYRDRPAAELVEFLCGELIAAGGHGPEGRAS